MGQLGGVSLTVQGDAQILEEHPAPQGTRAEVTELFAHLPARLWALESPATESKRALSLLSHYLLHHPGVRFKVLTDDGERWDYAGGSFHEAAKFVWGLGDGEPFVGARGQRGRFRAPRPSFPSRNSPARGATASCWRSTVARWDWPEALLKAVSLGYRELLRAGHHPVGGVELEPPLRHGAGQHRARQTAGEALGRGARRGLFAARG